MVPWAGLQCMIILIVVIPGHTLFAIKHGYYATVCMPGFKPNHCFVASVPLKLHNGGSGLRLNDDPDLKLSSKTHWWASAPTFIY